MPFSTYLPEHMGSIRLTPSGPFVAGAYAELTLTYTAGTFGIDDTGMVKISWRTTSDMSKPQFDKPAAHWKAIWPSLAVAGEPFRLAIVAEDAWGNPTVEAEQTLSLVPSRPIRGLPQTVAIKRGDGPRILDNLVADAPGDLELRLLAEGQELARANSLRVVAAAPLRRYLGDLH